MTYNLIEALKTSYILKKETAPPQKTINRWNTLINRGGQDYKDMLSTYGIRKLDNGLFEVKL